MGFKNNLRESVLENRKIDLRRQVYLVGDSHIAKCGEIKYHHNEQKWSKTCRDNNIRVPEISEIIMCNKLFPNGYNPPGITFLVMERVPGPTGFEIRDIDSYNIMIEQYKAYLSKLIDIGCDPHDSNFRGNLILGNNEELCLIDLEHWKFSSKSSSEQWNNLINYGKPSLKHILHLIE